MIGWWWKRSDAWSQPVLIGRGLHLYLETLCIFEWHQLSRVPIPEREPPGPIPNPAVKPLWADGSKGFAPCESR